MPRRAAHALRWQARSRAYALLRDGRPIEPPVRPETSAWHAWLADAASFAFESISGATCTVRKETRARGGEYWWAYRRTGDRRAKRYLGRAEELTIARLEEAAADLASPAARRPPARKGRAPAGHTPALSDGAGIHPATHASPAPLLTTKLHMPRAATPLIERPHVRQRLRRGLEVPLTLLTAPAGFGKTTALQEWLRGDAVRAAWLSLDSGDDDPLRFWHYALTALQQTWPGVGDLALAMLHAPIPPSSPAVAHTLLNAVESRPRQIILVLDDYHLITSPAIHEGIAALLERR